MHPVTGQHPLREHVFSYDQRDAKAAGNASTVIDKEDDMAGEPGRASAEAVSRTQASITRPPGRFRRRSNDARRPTVQHCGASVSGANRDRPGDLLLASTR
jgi:hypothetical protein